MLSNDGKFFITSTLIDGLRMSTLRVAMANSTYNATNITCTIVSIKSNPISTSNESEPALLLVQGI